MFCKIQVVQFISYLYLERGTFPTYIFATKPIQHGMVCFGHGMSWETLFISLLIGNYTVWGLG